MTDTILQKLQQLERDESIKILYACESGSRAWGFESTDSDYDVRFIYVRPKDEYLNIIESPDYTGLPVNEVLDIAGWDLKKTLKLFLKSNSTLYEWLQSPIVYQQDRLFVSELKELMPKYFSLRAGAHHYLSMAYNTFRDDLQTDQLKMKRYFYALRPILACLWILKHGGVPPMEFSKLRVLITDGDIQKTIESLLSKKKIAGESELMEKIPLLNHWLEATIEYCRENIGSLPAERNDSIELSALFKKHLN